MKRIFTLIVCSLALWLSVATMNAAPMQFYLAASSGTMSGVGEIDETTVSRFRSFLATHADSNIKRIILNSDGGSILYAMELGRAIRKAGLNTYVGGRYKSTTAGFTAENLESYGECYSACVYAFAGGVIRFFDANGGALGIHQFSSPEQNKSPGAESMTAQYLMALLGKYLDEMGVSRGLLDWAAMTDPGTMQPVPRGMAQRFRLDNTRSEYPSEHTSEPRVVRSNFGVRIKDVEQLRDGGNLFVESVVAGSIAAKAGLRPGDMINFINGHVIYGSKSLLAMWLTIKPGDSIRFEVERFNDAHEWVAVTLYGTRSALD
jgi:hypothetical protein